MNTVPEGRLVKVMVPRPLDEPLTYLDAFEKPLEVGDVVEVPFRKQTLLGFVTEQGDPSYDSSYQVKAVTQRLSDTPAFNTKDLKFLKWAADYYQSPLGEVIHTVFPSFLFKASKRQKREMERETESQQLEEDLALTPEQSVALQRISSAVEKQTYESFLLFGVTGSGKTEVYLQAARKVLDSGRTVLILVPEIALTPQLRSRFERRFGETVAVLHSSLSDSQRRKHWWAVAKGEKRLVVGARSALFAPLKDVGLIVVDEEHDASYKQEDHFRYNARDLALLRAKDHQAVAILGSATPSIETYYQAKEGKHSLLTMMNRPQSGGLPKVDVIDLRDEKQLPSKGGVLVSQSLRQAVEEALSAKKQVMVLINRKGYSHFLLCRDCGFVPECPRCSISLTYYGKRTELRCHYCGLMERAPDVCQCCQGREWVFSGFGTEQVEEFFKKEFPIARVGRLDAESASTPRELEEILGRIREGELDIIVGTQMLAKGHDFPNVTLVAILLAESSLHLPDFRSAERTFQLVSQVAGRAGRGAHAGRVVLQTYIPDHYVVRAAANHNYLEFYREELRIREEFSYPPFRRMAFLEFRNRNDELARREAESVALKVAQSNVPLMILGPVPAGVHKVNNIYRWQMILTGEKIAPLHSMIRALRKEGVRWIDIDPIRSL